MKRSPQAISAILNLLLTLGILIFINIIGQYFYTHIDLTEDKRFSLSEPTKNILNKVENPIYVQVLLEGSFPAGFKRLQRSIQEKLEDFASVNSYIDYNFVDPNAGSTEEINATRKQLSEQGIFPTTLRVMDDGERSEQLIYPYAIIRYGERMIPVNLLEDAIPGQTDEITLNNSISLLEYKLAEALQRILRNDKPIVLFTTGHDELNKVETADIVRSMRNAYQVGWIDLDSVYRIKDEADLVIVAKPRKKFEDKHKFILDQYIMKGGKVIWLIDRMNVALDSMNANAAYVPFDYDLNLEDQFFKYGFRINPDLALDLECSKIPMAIPSSGEKPQIDLFPWYYHSAVAPKSTHPVVKNLDRVNMFFPSTIDTLKTKTAIHKEILLTTSPYSRTQFSPVRLNFEILRYEPDPSKFDKKYLPLAVLLEGSFPSLYEHKVTESMKQVLVELGEEFKTESEATQMLVVSDGDLIKNWKDIRNKRVHALGYNPYDKYEYDNKQFLLNMMDYMLGEEGIIAARAKEVKLRLLDKVRTKSERSKWQLINIGGPLLLLLLFGILFNWWRKRRYAR